eukprot:8845884-Lingulodinium_polyedra.AAC.1
MEAKLEVAKNPELLATAGTTKQKASLKYASKCILLLAMYYTMRECFFHEKNQAIHVAFDANNIGGSEAEIGCIFSSAVEKAAWLPPIVLTSDLL